MVTDLIINKRLISIPASFDIEEPSKRSNICSDMPRSGIDHASLLWLEKLFRDTVGDQREIRKDDFRKIVISKNPFFTERVFQIFDRDNSGSISLQEFIDAMHQFAGQSPDDKIRFLFKVYDIDAK
ncbi:hypothetical protein J437_LFUL000524 [Ladona fulva]|uniref:EF-hand domain-containing protein n=1 Tax=Ladona fulva TaxID=123851 RepID=A0A8K0NRK1_LADFU|nr:hypothetical protein J437_LFUL000524 [Ladona fulva]